MKGLVPTDMKRLEKWGLAPETGHVAGTTVWFFK
ncbi:hypothetical protein [Pseudomonas sp. FEN]|nr:hypothetical protein [Pseudomonas sp. FEN]